MCPCRFLSLSHFATVEILDVSQNSFHDDKTVRLDLLSLSINCLFHKT